MWANKYVGIPFKANGRDEAGLDCWGLVRLVYKNEYNIDLPSFDTEYTIDDNIRIQELIAQYKEGWTTCSAPEPGSVILFRILGEQQHVGISIDSYHFLHVRENSDTAIEKLSNPKWSKRVVGCYIYTPTKTDIVLNAVPHPLKTERITLPVPSGTSIQQVYDWLQKEYTTSPELVQRVHIILNGRVIPKEFWDTTFVKDNDTLEYRAVAGKSSLRMVLLIAVTVAAMAAGQWAAGVNSFSALMAKTGVDFAIAVAKYAVTAAAVQTVGMKVIDKIAPIRTQETTDPGTTKSQYLFSGASNQANRYGAVPVILGKVRMTPPLGANTFIDYERKNTSYLNMMMVWGYGPLRFEESTFKIGNKELTNFYEVTKETIDGYGTPTPEELERFNQIYPEDLEQIYLGNELTWEGTPDPDTGGLSEAQLEEDAENDYEVLKTLQPVYVSQKQSYETGYTATLSPGDSTTITLTSEVAAYGRKLVVEYDYFYQGGGAGGGG